MRKINLIKGAIFVIISLFLFQCGQGGDTTETVYKDKRAQAEDMMAADPSVEGIGLDDRPLIPPKEAQQIRRKKDSLLHIAADNFIADSDELENIIWYGRRLGYIYRYREAIKMYTRGIERHPFAPESYRHRGHRYISIRELDKAIADFEKAAELVADRPIEIEPDGIPNKLNKPLSTLQFNIWYHWGLAHYLKGNFEEAARVYEKCLGYSTNPDLLCATTDWLYMTYKRLGEDEKAEKVLRPINDKLQIIENEAYFNRLMMYKGEKAVEELLDLDNTDPDRLLNIVTQGYGVGNWYLYNGQEEKAMEIFKKVRSTNYWWAFGYIAAETDIVRLSTD